MVRVQANIGREHMTQLPTLGMAVGRAHLVLPGSNKITQDLPSLKNILILYLWSTWYILGRSCEQSLIQVGWVGINLKFEILGINQVQERRLCLYKQSIFFCRIPKMLTRNLSSLVHAILHPRTNVNLNMRFSSTLSSLICFKSFLVCV